MSISPRHECNVGALITSTGLWTLLVPRSVLPAIGAPLFRCATNPMLCASHRRHLLRLCCTKTQTKNAATFKKGILKKNRVYRDAKAGIPACCDAPSSPSPPPPLSTCLQRVSTVLRGQTSFSSPRRMTLNEICSKPNIRVLSLVACRHGYRRKRQIISKVS